MNKKLGIISSSITAACTILFAVGILTRHYPLQYGSCLFLSWAYVLTACAFWEEAGKEAKSLALAGVAISVIYSVFTNMVYYSQLTTVAHGNPDFIEAILFTPGRIMFDFDLLGYGLMALSTFLLAFTIQVQNKTDKVLRSMLWIHGLFFLSCVFMPMFGVFKETQRASNALTAGDIALFIWCCYFTPIMILSVSYFRKIKTTS